jgi:hypothetical protein
MPVRVGDYELVIAMDRYSGCHKKRRREQARRRERIGTRQTIENKIRAIIWWKKDINASKRLMAVGLFTTVVLFCGAQVPIGIGEQGATLRYGDAVRMDGCLWIHFRFVSCPRHCCYFFLS